MATNTKTENTTSLIIVVFLAFVQQNNGTRDLREHLSMSVSFMSSKVNGQSSEYTATIRHANRV